jgi:selenocysteine-specific elongation factor
MHVLGTAGHVDHGKSTLIRALTGIDPDRLAEEKARGLTIDLGFAWMTLPSGREVGFVDVPGHERFVHNMLAGVGQIDATIFVVAADEGWKPQSEEHLAILDLLGARSGLIALTKADVAHDIERVESEVRERVRGTALDTAEVVRVSAVTGGGIAELLAAIDRALEATPESADTGRPRLFVDRSFTIKGVGTVVTGTLTGGSLANGEEVVVLPAGTRARIRSIQTHQVARDVAHPTSRVALNLAGLERHEVTRGDAVTKAGQWKPTDLLDVRLRSVRSLDHPITGRGAYLLYAGTAEVPARLRLLDAPELRAGGVAFARLTLSEPIVAGVFDRIVLRDTGRRETVAGGIVVDPHPAQRKLGSEAQGRRVVELQARAAARPETIAGVVLAERGVLRRDDFGWLSGARAAGHGVTLETHVASTAWFEQTSSTIVATLERLHAERPLERGVAREEVRSLAGGLDARLFAEVLGAIADRVVAEGPLLRLASHRVELSPELDEKRRALLEELDAAGFSPPSFASLENTYGATLVKALLDAGELTKLAADIALTAASVEQAKRVVTGTIEAEGPVSTSRLREALGTSRKYAIPLLEHLDATGVTVRRGDVRDVRR